MDKQNKWLNNQKYLQVMYVIRVLYTEYIKQLENKLKSWSSLEQKFLNIFTNDQSWHEKMFDITHYKTKITLWQFFNRLGLLLSEKRRMKMVLQDEYDHICMEAQHLERWVRSWWPDWNTQ